MKAVLLLKYWLGLPVFFYNQKIRFLDQSIQKKKKLLKSEALDEDVLNMYYLFLTLFSQEGGRTHGLQGIY